MELADYHGNSIGTATRYYLLAKRGTSEKAVMRDIGQAVEEEAPVNKYLPKICGICGVTNTFDAKVCKKCGNAMSIEAANERGLEFETMKKEVAALKEMMIQITLEKTTPQKK
jgi:ribosomal protein L40E